MSKVSIIIPFYNCSYIEYAIESALNQTYKDIEIIVVNDGSTIHSEKVKPYYDAIKYIEKENGGTGSALNRGVENATGDYFAWLSSDDMFVPQKIEKQLDYMKRTKSSFCHTTYSVINENNHITNTVILREEDRNSKLNFYQTMLSVCIINGCTVMLDMGLFSKIGLFDESLRYAQDYDFWLRAIQCTDCHYLSEPLTLYRIHENMASKTHQPEQEQEAIDTRIKHSASVLHLIEQEKERLTGVKGL